MDKHEKKYFDKLAEDSYFKQENKYTIELENSTIEVKVTDKKSNEVDRLEQALKGANDEIKELKAEKNKINLNDVYNIDLFTKATLEQNKIARKLLSEDLSIINIAKKIQEYCIDNPSCRTCKFFNKGCQIKLNPYEWNI